jgi:pimeloyl-ACP methyl ester carboxylesterase
LLVVDKSQCAAGLVAALIVALVLATKGERVLFAGGSITGLVAYILALQYFASGIRTLVASATAVNRFYPALERYTTLIDLGRSDMESPTKLNLSLEVTSVVDESVLRLRFAPGQRWLLLTYGKVSRELLCVLCNRIAVTGGRAAPGFVEYGFDGGAVRAVPSHSGLLIGGPEVLNVEAPAAVTIACVRQVDLPPSYAGCAGVLMIDSDERVLYAPPEWAAREQDALAARVRTAHWIPAPAAPVDEFEDELEL